MATILAAPDSITFDQSAELPEGVQPIIQQFINWADGFLLGAVVIAIIVCAICLAFQARSHRAGESGKGFAIVAVAALIGGMAAGLAKTLLGMV